MIFFGFFDVGYTHIYETMLVTSLLQEVLHVFFLDMTLSTRDVVALNRLLPAFTQLEMRCLMRQASFFFPTMLARLILHPYVFRVIQMVL